MNDVYEEYERGRECASKQIAASYRDKTILVVVFWSMITVTLGGLVFGWFVVALLSGVAAIITEIFRRRMAERWIMAGREHNHYQLGQARMNGEWREFEITGEQFGRPGHPYQDDLQILGKGSLFQMVCTARTQIGAERIAERFLEASSLSEIAARQVAVRELCGQSELRKKVACLGPFGSHDCGRNTIINWLSLPVLRIPPSLLGVLLLLSTSGFLLSGGVWAKLLVWTVWLPWIAVLVLPSLVHAWISRRNIMARLRAIRPLSKTLDLLFQGITLLERDSFNSPVLSDMVVKLRTDNAGGCLMRLRVILELLEQRNKPFFSFLAFFAYGTLMMLTAERWRERYQNQFMQWVDAWAEFEFLLAMSALAYERPAWRFPQVCAGRARFEARALAHPLLFDRPCVRNDLNLHAEERYLILSGSNMAGKSTLMRAIGLNTVLAYAGGPVSAETLTLTEMDLCTSISVRDSLDSGRSKFLAEVERLRDVINRVHRGRQVFFLVDEILSGTNAKDRGIVAEAFLREMPKGRVIGILTSHDATLLRSVPIGGFSMHLACSDPSDPLSFDYKLKPGIATASSALAIARMVGVLSAELGSN